MRVAVDFPRQALGAALLAVAAPFGNAAGITDSFDDYVAGYAGSRLGDLDVLSADVTYNPITDKFVFTGMYAADVGATPGGFYVWGVNRGAGTAGFAANGLPNVLFDAVVVFNQDGSIRSTGTTPATLLPAGTAQIVGSTMVGMVDGSLLPSTGFAKSAYTWNLWPRDGRLAAGFGQISDFAPDTNNAALTVVGAVPEPQTYALLLAGAAVLAWRCRRVDARN